MPKLLVISTYFHPDRGGGSAVNTDLCAGLAAKGFQVTVWTTYSHYPEWTDKSGKNGWKVQKELLGNYDVVRFGLFIPRNPASLWQRMLYEASFFLSALRYILSIRKFDAIMAFCPLVSSVGLGAIGSILFRKPLWLNVQDLAADAAAAGGIVKKPWLARTLQWFQTALFNRAAVWSTISPVMAQRLESLRHKNQPIHHLPNWLNESLAREIAALGSKLGRPLASTIRFLYAGNFGRKQDLVTLLRQLKSCRSNFHFQLHGSGTDLKAIQGWFATEADARFTLSPFLDEAGFARAIHDCDLFVIPEISESGDSFLPSKLIAIITAGTPILCISTPSSPLGHEIAIARSGPMLSWDQLDQLDALLCGIRDDPAQLKDWQRNALNRAAYFERNRIIGAFHDQIVALLEYDR